MTDDLRPTVAAQLAWQLRQMQLDAEAHSPAALARRAALRLAEQGQFGSSPRADAELLAMIRFAGDEPPPFNRRVERLLDDAMLVAHLVATTKVAVRDREDRASLGRDLRVARAAKREYETAIERIMHSILGADREDLPSLLRGAASLLESANQPISVGALVRHLGAWGVDGQWVQKRWSYDLWAQSDASDQIENTPDKKEPS